MRAISRVVLALSVSGIAASSVDAQVRGSERSVISQVVDGTTITVDYARPHARGRGAVWGNLVDWNHLWTPGANWATTFDFSKDVHLNGTPVPAGKYSVWMVAGPEEFEVVLDPDEEIFHVRRPERSDDQISLMAKAVEAPFREALTFSFPEVRADGTDILFQWGALQVPMEVKVPSTQVTTIAAAEAAPYPGTYDVTGLWSPEEEAAGSEAERWLGKSVMEIRHDGEHLVADWNVSARFGNVPTMFLPVAEGIFHPGWMSNGKLMETEMMLWVEFQVVDGIAVGWEMRDDLFDEVILRAVRRE
jgi:Protein of unknown function (DUF2911)